MSRAFRILVVFAAIMGADGVILAALSAHLPDAARLGSGLAPSPTLAALYAAVAWWAALALPRSAP